MDRLAASCRALAAQQILRLERGAVSSSQDSHLDLLKQAGIWLYGPDWIAPEPIMLEDVEVTTTDPSPHAR